MVETHSDIVFSFLLVNSYLNFVECLRYLSDELVTKELMDFAESLVIGFDDTVDNTPVADELEPTPVDINAVFIPEKCVGKGVNVVIHS